MNKKIISLKKNPSQTKVLSNLILTIEGSDDPALIVKAILNNPLDILKEPFVTKNRQLSMVNQTISKILKATPSQKKAIIRKHTKTPFDHNKESSLSEWIIFMLLNGHESLFDYIAQIAKVDIAKAEEILKKHQEARLLSTELQALFSSNPTLTPNKTIGKIKFLSTCQLSYIYNLEDLNAFIKGAEDLLKEQRETNHLLQINFNNESIDIVFTTQESEELCSLHEKKHFIQVNLYYKSSVECIAYLKSELIKKAQEKDYFTSPEDIQRFILHKLHVFYFKPIEKQIKETIEKKLAELKENGSRIALTQNRRSGGGKDGGSLLDRGELVRFEILLRMPTEFAVDAFQQKHDMEINISEKTLEPRARKRLTFMIHGTPIDFNNIEQGFHVENFMLRHQHKGGIEKIAEAVKEYCEHSMAHAYALLHLQSGGITLFVEHLTEEVNRIALQHQ